MSGLIVNPRARIFHGHEWVYAGEVRRAYGDPRPGDVIRLKDVRNRPLGSAIYNPASQIVARRISRRSQDVDVPFFERRLARAADLRSRLGFDPGTPHRLVWSESDGLPGVIVDRYGDHVVVQTLTLGMDLRKDRLVEALGRALDPASIVERNDSPIRKAEGLPAVSGVLHGEVPETVTVTSPAGIRFETSLLSGQKTGLYLDQFDNYGAVARHAAGRRVLDLFSNQGGFALHAARAGALSVEAVDISEDAVDQLRRNAALNGVEVDAIAANAFDHLRAREKEALGTPDGSGEGADDEGADQEAARGATEGAYDLVILDPPSFTRNRGRVGDALRGYKEIHLRALRLLRPGGMLATFCCSHHVSAPQFREAICAASVDARRTLREAEVYRQRVDHPVIPTIPESEYLKGFLFEVLGGW